MKKSLALLLSLVMAATALFALPFNALADDPINDGAITLNTETAVTIANEGEVHYFEFTPAESGWYAFRSEASGDTKGAIYDSTGENELAFNDDGYYFLESSANFYVMYEMTADVTYRLQAWYYNSTNTGTFNVRVVKADITPSGSVAPDTTVNVDFTTGNEIFRYTVNVEKDDKYYVLVSADSETYCSLTRADTGGGNSFHTQDGYLSDYLYKTYTYYLDVRASKAGAKSSFEIKKENYVNAPALYLGDNSVTIENSYEVMVARFTPSQSGIYRIDDNSDYLSVNTPYYLDDKEAQCNAYGNWSRTFLEGGVTYYIVYYKTTNSPLTATISIKKFDHQHGAIAVGEEKSVAIENAWDVHEYLFTPETSGTYEYYCYDNVTIDSAGMILDENYNVVTYNDDGDGMTGGNFKMVVYLEAGKSYIIADMCYGSSLGSNKIIINNITETHVHEYSVYKTVNPTCLEQGYTVYKCNGCDHTYNGNYTEPKGHDIQHYTAVAATCTESGTEHYYCSRGDYEYDEEIEPLGHDMAHITSTHPTCTETGEEKYYCKRCTYCYYETLPANGHTMTHYTTQSPTCTDKGKEYYYCTVCGGNDYYEPIDALGHDWKYQYTVNPTCSAQGYDYYVCNRCGTDKEDNYTDTSDHTWNEGEVTTEPTCVATGVKTYTCTVCSTTKTETVAATGIHTPAPAVDERFTEPTCTKDGYHYSVVKCSVCGLTISQNKIIDDEALGHTPAAAVKENEIAATYVADGSYESVVYCSVCGDEISRTTVTVPKLDKLVNTLTAKGLKRTVKFATLKTKNVTIKRAKAITVKNAKGKVTYKKAKGNKKITVSKAGKITVKKGLKKGTYKVKIKVTAAGTDKYAPVTKTVTVTVVVN